MDNTNNKKKTLLTLLTLLITLGAIEGISWIGLKILENSYSIVYDPTLLTELSRKHRKALTRFVKSDFYHTEFSGELGWINKPNSNVKNGAYITNSMRIRSTREFPVAPPENSIRIASFGDSFTFGSEVPNEDAWQEQLYQINNKYEPLNFGVGGYGLDQAYLRYQHEGVQFRPDIVVIGFMTENINRIVNVYRPYYVKRTGVPLTKPRFIIVDDKLTLIKNPHQTIDDYKNLLDNPEDILPILGEYDHYYHSLYASHNIDIFATIRLFKILKQELLTSHIFDKEGVYNENSEAYLLLQKIIQQFYSTAIRSGAVPIVMIYPDFSASLKFRKKDIKNYQPLVSWLQQQNYNHLDLMDAIMTFRKSGTDGIFFTKGMGHYSEYGNQFVARQMDTYLTKKGLTSKASVKSQVKLLLQESQK